MTTTETGSAGLLIDPVFSHHTWTDTQDMLADLRFYDDTGKNMVNYLAV